MSELYEFGGPSIDVPCEGVPAGELIDKLSEWLDKSKRWLAALPEDHHHTAVVRCHTYCDSMVEMEIVYSRPLTQLEAWRNQPDVRRAEMAAAAAAGRPGPDRGDKYYPPMPADWEPAP